MVNQELVINKQDTEHTMKKDLLKGAYGEYLVKRYLSKYYKDKTVYAEDKSEVYEYQRADIDFLIQFKNRETQAIEVKNDNTVFPNLFFEIVSTSKEGSEDNPGCMIVSEADILFYIYEPLGISIVVPLPNLRNWVIESFEKGLVLEEKPVKNKEYTAKGYSIPVITLMGETKGFQAVEGITIRELETNELLTYRQYEYRRKKIQAKANGSYYVQVKKRAGWENRNKQIWKNKGVLSRPTRTYSERKKHADEYIQKLHIARQK